MLALASDPHLQAAKDDAYWASLELRHDRVYRLFSYVVLQKLANVAVMGGDADVVVGSCIEEGSVAHVSARRGVDANATTKCDAQSR